MANPEHLAVLRRAYKTAEIAIWNKWIGEQRDTDNAFRPDLRDADLGSTYLHGANLSAANLSRANLADAFLSDADLRGAQLYEANLNAADLTDADLSWANIGYATLNWADLKVAHLTEADIRMAELVGAQLYDADLSGADLTGAKLNAANLHQTNLHQTNLSKAVLGGTQLDSIDLSQCIGLDTVIHMGLSPIDMSTFYKSGGKIPHVFLRGAGVPEELITFIRHQIGSAKAVEFYSAFISYSSADDDFARRLHADLQARGVRVWFAPEDLKIGDRLHSTIDEAIRLYDKLMVVLSENSIHSAWVRREVKTALEKEEKQDRTVLFPVRLDDSVFNTTEQWADDLRRDRHIGDFSKWKSHDDYQKAFERLLRDLNAKHP